MKPEIKQDILSVLEEALKIIKREDIPALDELSNHTIHDASIYQDKDPITIAVVIYALSKIVHRSEFKPEHWKEVSETVIKDIEDAKAFLENDEDSEYRKVVKNILRQIGKVDDKLKLYIEDVLDKARIVKGSKLYGHGISVERAAELLGISQWELMSYVGKTQIVDAYAEEVIPVNIRLDHAKRIFGL